MARALAGIILTKVGGGLRVAVIGEQAAEQCQADFIPFAEQAVNFAAEKQTKHLPKNQGERTVRQILSYFDD